MYNDQLRNIRSTLYERIAVASATNFLTTVGVCYLLHELLKWCDEPLP
jgi:hypothetical protein